MIPTPRRLLAADGLSDRAIRAAVREGALRRIRRGFCADAADWSAGYAEAHERALAQAAHAAARFAPVFSHTTAAALHGLPLVDHDADRAHVMARQSRSGGSNAAVLRHRDRWDGCSVELAGLRVTPLARTVLDVARCTRRTTALACADAALRRVGLIPGTRALDIGAAEALRRDALALADDARGAPGIRRAREVIGLADPRAESPGESVSRLHLHDLGFRGIGVQVAVAAGGSVYVVDLEFAGILGEFDGAAKYLDAGMRGARSAEQVVWDEKRREDRVRAATGKRMLRWGWPEIATRERFRRFLLEHGIRP
ncbi:hypothetical protein [Microbacterium sp. Marseille-Q6965]|uniref:hypothetical protein n=1 Tax=Microbacterium sp. Marseille-Q6965 TaxID=2965072 RepID=UPI0021B6FCC1|nr:hypothetical protein [Microbacterium sp. Marseille-Q6965]